jgi:hypothetical protein
MQETLLTQVLNLKPDSVEPIEFLATETGAFPYFSPLHFLLLKQTPKNNPQYELLAAKAALHVNNPLLLNVRLKTDANSPKTETLTEISSNIIEQKEITEEVIETKQNEEVAPKEELLFEPLFTSDYFAAQGIKLSEEMASNDQLGKQLKSFTAWLKTMKRVHGNRPPEAPNVDKQVEKMAETSNQNTTIITEAMAEIYLKQGKLDQAKDVYRKLSLQNPSKSVYFADKIEQLKAI